MRLDELLLHLCEGEFANISLGVVIDDAPKMEHYTSVLRLIEVGLLELHKRFPLRKREVFIQQYDHIQNYVLHSKYAATNTASTEPYKYIEDTVYNQFLDHDFIQIEELYNEDGQPIALNDRSQQYSMYTSAFNTIQVPYPESANNFIVIYRAGHPAIDKKAHPSDIDIALPYSHLEALLFYVAGRKLSATNPEESQMYLAKFEMSCAKLIELNLRNEDNSPYQQFFLGGWI